MAILNFMPQFISTSKKKLWDLQDKDHEQEAAVDSGSGFFGSVFEYVDDAFDWTPAPEPEEFVEQPAYEEPAWDFSDQLDTGFGGIGSAIGDAFGGIQWGEPDPGIGSAIGDFGFDDYQLENTVGAPVEAWGWEQPGFQEDWWVANQDFQPTQQWDLPIPVDVDAPNWGEQIGSALTPQWEPSSFASNIMDAHEGDDVWGDVVDMRDGMGDPALTSETFTGQPLTEQGGWQIPDFGSTFRDIAGGFGSALKEDPVDYSLSLDWPTNPDNWAHTPGEYSLSPDWSPYTPYEWQTLPGENADVLATLPPDEKASMYYAAGLTRSDIPAEEMATFSNEWQDRLGFAASQDVAGIGDGLASLWGKLQTGFNAGGQTIGDVVFDPTKGATDLNNLGVGALFPMVFEGVNAVVPGSPFPDYDLDTPGGDTAQNAMAADDPWAFLEMQEDDFSERPLAEQIALQAYLPGSGTYGAYDDLPRGLSQLERFGDIVQGGPLLGALGDIPGAGTFAKNVVVPGAAGGGLGAATEIFDPTFHSPYTDPVTGESAEYNPSFWESVGGGTVAAILGKNASELVPGQGIRDVGDEFVLPAGLKNAKPTYGNQMKSILPQFQDDLDKALYIVRDASKKSASDEKFMTELREYFPELSDAEIRAKGTDVRDAIKMIVKDIDPKGVKNMPVEIPPIVRAVDEEVLASPVMDEFYGLPRTSENPDYVPFGAANDAIDSGVGLRWEPLDESIPDLNDVTFDAPPAIQPELQPLLDKVNLQREWLATTDRVARRKGWYQESQRLYDEAYEQALERGYDPSSAARAGRGAQRGFVQENGLESLNVSTEVRNAMAEHVDRLVNERVLSPDKRSMVSRVMDTWANGKSPDPSELNEFYRIITGRDAIEKPISRFASETVPGSRQTISEVVDELANAKLTPEEQAIIGASDDVAEPPKPRSKKPKPGTPEELARDISDEAYNDQTLLIEADTDEWLRQNRPVFEAIGWKDETGLVKRGVGGALENKLADTITQRARNLEQKLGRVRGLSAEEARDITNSTIAKYLDDRRLTAIEKGTPEEVADGLLEHALTALRYGDFEPVDPAGKIEVAKGVGNAAPLFKNLQSANSQMKNQMYGIADASVLHGNVLPAITGGWPQLVAAYTNRLANALKTGVDISEAKNASDFAGLLGPKAQDATAPQKGMLALSGTANVLDAVKEGNSLSKGLRVIDRPLTRWNEFLTKKQFDDLLYKTFRQPIYEGNLILLKATGNDINDPEVRRAAARMANAVTSAAPMASGNNRRAIEGSLLNTAQFTRGQGDLLLTAAKVFSPSKKTSMAERVIGLSTIATIASSIYGAHELLGLDFEIDPTDPDFGNVRLPDGTVLNIFPQKQLAKVLVDTGDFLRTQNPEDLYQSWAQFLLGRAGPLVNTAAKGLDVGFDPTGDTPGWNYPGPNGFGKGDGWGRDMSTFDKVVGFLPLPTAYSQTVKPLMDDEIGPATAGLNTAGANTYPESELDKALQKEGLKGVDDVRAYFREEFPDSSESRIRKFFQKYPEARTEDDELEKIRNSKKSATEAFETSRDKQTVSRWRDRMNELSDQTSGIFLTKEIKDGERPDEDGAAQWIFDYNKTFQEAKDDEGEIDGDVLERLQSEFWSEHKSPAVRKEVLQYQLANANTDAEKMYIEDMARLNGFNPKTGKALTWSGGTNKMPSYFEMERYSSMEMKNDETKKFLDGFTNWRQDLSGPVADLEKDKLIDIYIDEEAHARPNGKSWTAASIADAKNYGKLSKYTPEFKAYKDEMAVELLWFNPDQHWDSIEAAHDRRK